MGAVQAIVDLPDAAINGSKQRRTDWHAQLKGTFDRLRSTIARTHPMLNDEHARTLWSSRSGRSIAEQGSKAIAACRKLKKSFRVLAAMQTTGNPTEADLMRCATGLYNDAIKVSHVYDVIRNETYNVGKSFTYPLTFSWLNNKSSELDTVPDVGESKTNSSPIPGNAIAAKGAASGGSTSQSAIDLISSEGKPDVQSPAERRGGKGSKAAKLDRKMQVEANAQESVISKAFAVFTETFKHANMASVEAGEERAKREHDLAERNYSLRKSAAEVEAVKVLFNDDSEESKMFKKTMQRRRLRALMDEEEELRNQRSKKSRYESQGDNGEPSME